MAPRVVPAALAALVLLAPSADAQWRAWDVEEWGPSEVHREVYRSVSECAGSNRVPDMPRWAQATRINDGSRDHPVVWDSEADMVILDQRVWRSRVWISFGVLSRLYSGGPVPVRVMAECLVTEERPCEP